VDAANDTNQHRARVLDIVVPCMNEADSIDTFLTRCEAVAAACSGYRFAYLFVDDGSTDDTWAEIASLALNNPHVRGLRLARNYGQQRAISAGLDACQGDAAAILDADLQDPPELLTAMLAKLDEGFDIVHAVRTDRTSDGAFKRLSAWAFYAVMRRWVLPELPENAGDFKVLNRRALDAARRYGERVRFLRGTIATLGFAQTTVSYTRPPRHAGQSKYPLQLRPAPALVHLHGPRRARRLAPGARRGAPSRPKHHRPPAHRPMALQRPPPHRPRPHRRIL
jgi:dolichol-phosphate mannosyltransferase